MVQLILCAASSLLYSSALISRAYALDFHMDVIGAANWRVDRPAIAEIASGQRRLYCGLRWSFELFFASALLILLSPLLVLVAVLIKVTSKGPVFYSQVRVGRDGKTFLMYKFRTMGVEAERYSGPVWAKDQDPRCTWIGVFLRRWSVDELPQLINVIRGEMSLVGPRPERPFFVDQFQQKMPHYDLRHCVPPGITGWAQVHGWRGNTSIEERLVHDLYYVRHQSLRLDLMVLLRTPFALLGVAKTSEPHRS